jgi:LysM repeat protein
MKRLLIILFCLPLFVSAQDKTLVVEGTSPNLYLNHTVSPKENYYSIGRMYNISPKEFAPYNHLTLDKGLALGQIIKIPLTSNNFVQSGSAATDEVLVPVYHTVKDKEGLFHMSEAYNKLPVATLKKWNNISGDAVSNGTNLIVGYLKVKKDLSPLAIKGETKTNLGEENTLQVKPAKEISKPITKSKIIEAPKEEVVTQPEIKKEEPVKERKTEVKTEPIVTEPVETNGKEFNGGVFKNDFSKQTQDKNVVKENGAAAIFKSTSGWEDGKYYCLYNAATSGTIIKVTNNATGKSVYAKVLDMIPDIKQNNGVVIRLSNAAAGELGVNDENKFDCTLEYGK